jgi:hypothetical protein
MHINFLIFHGQRFFLMLAIIYSISESTQVDYYHIFLDFFAKYLSYENQNSEKQISIATAACFILFYRFSMFGTKFNNSFQSCNPSNISKIFLYFQKSFEISSVSTEFFNCQTMSHPFDLKFISKLAVLLSNIILENPR